MFWDKWALWQQMSLVLAFISAAVCVFGVSRIWWIRIQRRRITTKAEISNADKEELGEVEQIKVTEEPKEEEIPFGIRALEAGVEVEGVVISRPASPRPTSPRISHYNNSNVTLPAHDARGSFASLVAGVHGESPRSSIGPPSPGLNSTFRDNYPMMHPIRGVHQPNPYSNAPFNHGASSSTVQHQQQSHNSSPIVTRNPSVENVSDHSLPRYQAPRGTSPAAYSPAPARVSMLSMQQRRSGSYNDPGRSVTPGARSPSPQENHLLPVLEYEAGPSRHSDTSDSHGEDSQSSPAETPPDGGRTGDLTLLRTHRLSHAAEVGQLSRRTPGSRPQSQQPVYQSPPAPPQTVVFPTAASPLYAVDTAMPTQVSPTDRSPDNASRMSISTFQFNQNVELARELFQPHLAETSTSEGTASPIDENLRSDGERSKETSPSRPNSISSKKMPKKLAKKPRPTSVENRA